jgi:hypothetical protein
MYIVQTSRKKFLGLIIDDALSWKNHIDYITAKLNSASFAIRTVKHVKRCLKKCYTFLIYILSYGVLFCVNSSDSTKILTIQNKIIRIIANLRNRESCTNIFKIMNIPPFYSQYIFSCLVYITKNKHLCINNQEIHNINTRSNPQFHISSTNLTKSENGVY